MGWFVPTRAPLGNHPVCIASYCTYDYACTVPCDTDATRARPNVRIHVDNNKDETKNGCNVSKERLERQASRPAHINGPILLARTTSWLQRRLLGLSSSFKLGVLPNDHIGFGTYPGLVVLGKIGWVAR